MCIPPSPSEQGYKNFTIAQLNALIIQNKSSKIDIPNNKLLIVTLFPSTPKIQEAHGPHC